MYLLAALPLIVSLLAAGAIWRWAEELAGWSTRRTNWTSGLFVAGGLVATGAILFAVVEHERRTIAEADVLRGDGGIYSLEFDVRSPGVEHSLSLLPKRAATNIANEPVSVLLRVLSSDGSVTCEAEYEFTVRGTYPDPTYWSSRSFPFTPSSTGRHRVEIRVLTGAPASMNVWVGDDG